MKLELSATGIIIYTAEVEASETSPYRPRREIARMTVDDLALARELVRRWNLQEEPQ